MSDSTDPGNRSAADIEADVEQTRLRVARTIDALRDSMSPGQIMDQVVDYARTSGGAEFTRNLGAAVRDNPLPIALIGAGIGWLLLSGQNKGTPHTNVVPVGPQRMLPPPPSTRMHVVHQSSGPGVMERVSQTTASVRDGAEQTISSVGSSIGQAAGTVGSAVSQAASSVGNAVGQAVSGARDAIGSVASSASGAASSVASSASDVAGSMGSALGSANDTVRAYRHDATHMIGQGYSTASGSAGQLGGQLRQGWNRASTEQPLLLGALGIALGAALGALLPRTETEDRLMGETSDSVTRQLSTAAQEQYEQAKEVVTERVGEVRDKLSEGAPSASSIGDAVTDAARRVTEAVGKTAQELGDTAKSGIEKQDLPKDKPAQV
jgi:ElaB/YqjD/DUF883 family membrane-anchored ribosome-binding protein